MLLGHFGINGPVTQDYGHSVPMVPARAKRIFEPISGPKLVNLRPLPAANTRSVRDDSGEHSPRKGAAGGSLRLTKGFAVLLIISQNDNYP